MSRIGLVMSGGMAKGAYQIGALKAIAEYFRPEEIKYVSAASVGVLNAYAFSAGNLDTAEHLWLSLNDEKEKKFITSVYKSDYLHNSIDLLSVMQPKCEKFFVPLVDPKKMRLIYVDFMEDISKEKRIDYMRASIAFPIISGRAVKIDESRYIDGAMVDNIPVFPLMEHDLDYIICMYFDEYNFAFESTGFDGKIIKLTFDDNKKVISESVWFTREKIEEMINSGYELTKASLDFALRPDKYDIPTVLSHIATLNRLHPYDHFRITGDVVVNNMNRLAKHFFRKEIMKQENKNDESSGT